VFIEYEIFYFIISLLEILIFMLISKELLVLDLLLNQGLL
jgi:hypothetical protein